MTTTPGIAGIGNNLTNAADLSLNRSFDPEGYAAAFSTVLRAASVAYRVSTLVNTNREQIRVPLLTGDSSTQLVGENQAIPLSHPTLSEITVQPVAFKTLTQVSNEALRDAEPAILSYLALGMANQIQKSIDSAFWANTTSVSGSSNTLAGVASLSASYQLVNTGTYPLTSLDPFFVAQEVAYGHNAVLTDVVLAPDVALTLSQAKTFHSAGTLSDVNSNESLFGSRGVWSVPGAVDGTAVQGSTVELAGLTVHISPQLGTGLAYAFDRRQVLLVERQGTEVTSSPFSAFGYDAFQVRATHRVAFGFANPAGVIRIASS
jgi:hypothetical protein